MKKLLLIGAAFAALIVPAIAAEKPVRVYKRPVVAAAPVSSWSGFYIGGALGGKWANNTWTTTSLSDLPSVGIIDASSPRNFGTSGFRAGGYAGYNWQLAAWVVGLEADLAGASNTATAAGFPGCTILCFSGFPGPGVDISSVKMGWDASVRARAGYLIIPDLLIYGTSGIAWQEIRSSGTCQHSLADPLCTRAGGSPFDTQSNRDILTGWTIGGGLEKMYGSWMLRAEYRFSQFAHTNDVLPFSAAGVPVGQDFLRYRLSTQSHIATVGLAYKLGNYYAPVVTK